MDLDKYNTISIRSIQNGKISTQIGHCVPHFYLIRCYLIWKFETNTHQVAYIITDACVKCKYTNCVDVCPVDCFREGDVMLVIDPEICIDCGVCEPECPVGAIVSESAATITWIERNAELSKKWPKISNSKAAPQDANLYSKETNKFEKYCSELSIDQAQQE